MAANIKIPAREQEASLHEPATAGIRTDSAAAGCNHTRCVAYASSAMFLFKLLLLWANETEADSPGGSFTALCPLALPLPPACVGPGDMCGRGGA